MTQKSKIKYSNITNLDELRHQRRVLNSKLEYQEMMVAYRVRMMASHLSPKNVMFRSLEALSAHSPVANIALKAYDFFTSIRRKR